MKEIVGAEGGVVGDENDKEREREAAATEAAPRGDSPLRGKGPSWAREE